MRNTAQKAETRRRSESNSTGNRVEMLPSESAAIALGTVSGLAVSR